MEKYKLIFAPEFVKDLNDAFEYIIMTLSNEQAAKKLMKKIDGSIVNLKELPKMYPMCRGTLGELGYRKIVVDNYIMVYSVDEKLCNVNLLRCFYGKQNYIDFFKNLSSQDMCADFRANFDEDKAKDRSNTVVLQGLSTQSSSKFAEKMRAIACEDRF